MVLICIKIKKGKQEATMSIQWWNDYVVKAPSDFDILREWESVGKNHKNIMKGAISLHLAVVPSNWRIWTQTNDRLNIVGTLQIAPVEAIEKFEAKYQYKLYVIDVFWIIHGIYCPL